MKADLLTQIILPAALFIIMFGMGLSLKLQDFALVVKKPKAMAIGLFAQMVLLPLLGLLVVVVFALPAELGMGLMILALCPGGTTSNLFTYLARGDVALSVSLTAVVSLLAPFTIPVLALFAMQFLLGSEQAIELPLLKTILQLIIITLVPVGLGMLCCHYFPRLSERADKPVRIFSIVFLALIITGIILKNRAQMPQFIALTGPAALALNVLAIALGYVLARFAKLNGPQARAIGLEVGIQNGTTALLIALSILHNEQMAIAPTVYSILMFVTAAAFSYAVTRKTAD